VGKLVKDPKIPHKLRIQAYEATVLNFLLFGCEIWALKVSDRRQKLEACHHIFLRSMLNISIYNVKENQIKNPDMRQELDRCYTLTQSMELQRARWLKKLANMPETRNPQKVLVAWTQNLRPSRRPRQTIRQAYVHTFLEKELHMSSELNDWIPKARDHKLWADKVEHELGLAKNTYKLYKLW